MAGSQATHSLTRSTSEVSRPEPEVGLREAIIAGLNEMGGNISWSDDQIADCVLEHIRKLEGGPAWMLHVAHTGPPAQDGARTVTIRHIGPYLGADGRERAEQRAYREERQPHREDAEILATVHPLSDPDA